ncbi:MAG: hypothetical protein HY788_16235 [Deltaproteobacteria bacterium]|nr:hypothetical protein [Deltaproteobacteria bacterium]
MRIRIKKVVTTMFGAALLLGSLTAWVGTALAGNVEIQLPSTNGGDSFQVEDALSSEIFQVLSNGRVAIGTTNPHDRKLHISTAGNLVKFEYTGTAGHAALDLDSPNILVGNLCRLDWRSNDSNGNNDQFAAIDVVYRDKTSGSEDADMVFRTMKSGSNDEHMVISHEGFVGIGYSTPSRKLHVKDSQSTITVVNFENTYNGSNADVMNLKINRSDPGVSNRFITFYDDVGVVGRIEGNGAGGITWVSGGLDFAEWLPRLDPDEIIDAGEIVGVFGGEITKATTGADQIMAVAAAPLVLGNAPDEESESSYEKVAFIGQIPIKVRGPVRSGDYIVPSGLDDGTGMAVSPEAMTPDLALLVVGKAWETATGEDVKPVNVAVGLHTAAPSLYALNLRMDVEIKNLKQANDDLLARLEALERQVRSLQQGLR